MLKILGAVVQSSDGQTHRIRAPWPMLKPNMGKNIVLCHVRVLWHIYCVLSQNVYLIYALLSYSSFTSAIRNVKIRYSHRKWYHNFKLLDKVNTLICLAHTSKQKSQNNTKEQYVLQFCIFVIELLIYPNQLNLCYPTMWNSTVKLILTRYSKWKGLYWSLLSLVRNGGRIFKQRQLMFGFQDMCGNVWISEEPWQLKDFSPRSYWR
jgi:hypothetical protein